MKSIARFGSQYFFRGMLVCLAFAGNRYAEAQQPNERYQSIPGDSLSLTSIDLATLRNSKELEWMPWEVFSAFGKEELGIDPMLISSIDISAGMPSINGPEFGVSINTTAPVDIAKLNDRLFTPVTVSPKVQNMRTRKAMDASVRVTQMEPQRVLVGTEGTLRRMVSNKSKPSKIIDIASSSKYPYRTVTALQSVRPLIDGAFADAIGYVPPPLVDDIQTVIDELDYIVTESDPLGSLGTFEVKFVAKDSESAKKLSVAMDRLRKNGMVFGEQAILQAVEREANFSTEVKDSIKQYLARLKVFLGQAELWKLSGEEIAVKGQVSYAVPTIGVLTGLLLPAVQAAREAARRMQSSNNLKQVCLAMHNYESTYKQIPPRASKDANGKPLLSWRVALLPYIEQVELYKKFRLDEPWDSEHNIKLLDQIPPIYVHPNFTGPRGHTVYLTPYFNGTVWTKSKPRFSEITDGLSNTIAFVEVNDAHAVPWTKPDDVDLEKLELTDCFRSNGSNIGLFDGSVQMLPKNTEKAQVKAMVSSAGGEEARYLPR